MTTIYSIGTVTVANGGTTVIGVGTSWSGKIFEGDLFTDPAQGLFARVTADVTDNELMTINPWPGVGMSGDAYEVILQADSIRMSERMRRYVELAGAIANTGIGVDAFGAFADRAGYDDEAADFAFLSLDGDGALVTEAVIFIKASSDAADWSDAIPVQGATGQQGEPGLGVWEGAWVTATAYAVDDIVEHEGSSYICVEAHTSGTFATDLAAVKWELLVEKGDDGITWQGAYSGATAYALDDAVLYNGSSWIALQATTGNAPPTLPTESNAYWQLMARQGTDGAGTVESVVAGAGITVDNTDPTAPVVSAISFRGARVKMSAGQSIPTSTAPYTPIGFDQEDYDTSSLHSTSSNNSRLTVPAGVTKVKVTAQANFQANGTGYRILAIYKNGADLSPRVEIMQTAPIAGTSVTVNVATGVVPVVAGDYFEAVVYQSSGGALNIQSGATWATMEIIE